MIEKLLLENQTLFGIASILISLTVAILYIRKILKELTDFNEFNLFDWRFFISIWVLILFFLYFGFNLLL